ncbi:MAG: aldo/keto reductase [Eubacteriales bacterium]|nr:aldo/keto reductase [Eubacteriales bacterium]
MLYGDFQGMKLSRLGFGTMRLPLVAGAKDGAIDEAQVAEMVQYAIEHGVNYFDTAYPYHGGLSEVVVGRALKRYPRDAFYLATKYPGHQISDSYDPAAIFEEQLTKCGVDYFDFYLLHNVCENSIGAYTDPRWGIIDYFLEQKKNGRIRHLGFSSHAAPDTLRTFLDAYGDKMEFCQIQLNYLDWTLQDAKGKYELLTQRGIPVWVMEPVRGGRLAKLNEADEAKLRALRPQESVAAWGFRYLQALPNVKMILSGMSNMEQMEDNVKTFSAEAPLNEDETQALYAIADGMRNTVPCTGCRYCCDGCPMGLDIPLLIQIYNDIKVAPSITAPMRLETMPEDKQPAACVGCGACAAVCPQHIDVPQVMQDMDEALKGIPKWSQLCKERAAAAAALRAGSK